MSANAKTAMFLSLLDLISCALGAAILLAVIFSIIESPFVAPKSDDFIAAEYRVNNRVQLGVMLYHLESNNFVLLTPDQARRDFSNQALAEKSLAESANWFSAYASRRQENDNGSSIFAFTLNKPARGTWFVAPYLYSYEDDLFKESVTTASLRYSTKSLSEVNCQQENLDWNASAALVDRAALEPAVINSQPENDCLVYFSVTI